jgi:hypothetical protein
MPETRVTIDWNRVISLAIAGIIIIMLAVFVLFMLRGENIDWNELARQAIISMFRNAPQIALAIVILWRVIVKPVKEVKQQVTELSKLVDGRISELKGGLVAKGELEGLKRAIDLIRETREDVRRDLLTPTAVIPVEASQSKGEGQPK